MIRVQRIGSKKILTWTNEKAHKILNSAIGSKYRVLDQAPRVEAPPEVTKVSISPKTQEVKQGKNKPKNKNAD